MRNQRTARANILTFLLIVLIGTTIGFVGSPVVEAGESGVALTLRVGTEGAGADLGFRFSDSLAGRVGFSAFLYSSDKTYGDVDYEIDANLSLGNLLVDWYPGGRDFRLTGGAILNNNELKAVGVLVPGTTYEIGGVEYTAEELGSVDGVVDYDSFAPYLGIGWGNPFNSSKSWSFQVDLGVFYQGTGDLVLTAENPQNIPGMEEALEAEAETVLDEIDDYKIYPVVAVGVSYRF